MKKTQLIIYFSIFSLILQAQNPVQIKGIVKDAVTNELLIGVNLIVTGSNVGTVTGFNGDFTISVPLNATLKVSYIGYQTQEIKITDQKTLNILLAPESKMIDEVVVVGYTVQKKRDVLGAVSKVSSEELTKIPVASAQEALQGRVAGVEVSAQTGAPGAPISVRIRGASSISSSNDPLYIVDGIPVEGALNNLSPNDIENITILKDASSAAIYGSRASNGVVLITTKSGNSGETQVTYNAQIGFQTHGHLTPMATTSQYIQMYNEAATADNLTSVVQRPLLAGSYMKDFPNVNHVAAIFQVAPIQSHELSISGGNDKTRYLISANYFNQVGIITNTGYDRFSMRSNITSEIKKWLHVSLNVSGGISDNRTVSSSGDGYVSQGGSVIRYAFFRNPAIPIYSSPGVYVDLPSAYYGDSNYDSFFGNGYSPEGLAAYTDMTTQIKTLLATGNVIVNFPANIFWKTTMGVDYSDAGYREFDRTWGTLDRINNPNALSVSDNTNVNWTVNSTLNYSTKLGENQNLTTMIGVEAIRNSSYGLSASDSNFASNDPNFLYIGNGVAAPPLVNNVSGSQGESGSTLLSYFANANYNYAEKYYLSGIIRRDGSSRFVGNNQWGTFYSASTGWNIDTEDFMKDVQNISKLKLRAGYGSIGNQNIALYANLDRYSPNNYYTFGGNPYNGYAQTALGNTDLKWETSNQFNAGVDLEMFKGVFGASIDYYNKLTTDMLVVAPLPPSVGNASPPWINSGNMLNTGVDLELFYKHEFKGGGFNISLNGGYLHNDVVKLAAPIVGGRVDDGSYATQTIVGQPIGAFYLYKMVGIFQNQTDILTSAYQGKNIQPGDVKYEDVNHDGVIDAKDRVYMGSAIPTFTAGLTLSGHYSGFDISLFFQGAYGQKIYSQINQDIEGFYRGFDMTERYYLEHWTTTNPSNSQPRASWAAAANNIRASSRFLEDGSYTRLKNVQIGYTIPNTKKIKIQSIRIYLAATNLLTLTGYTGLDPEMTVSTNSAAEGDRANGIDWGTYPVAVSYTFGLNVTF
jgi:TonB-linked SusC/RagA family outer membrane protein